MPDHQQILKRSSRGQALVLAALSLFLLALMVALSFNLSHALRQKTRLQQHSDSMAYSMAVLQARTLNYFAMSNRAIAATFVAMNTVHGYMSAASVTAEMMRSAETNFYMVAGVEFVLCIPCPWTGSACKHCVDGIQALRIARKFNREARDYDNRIKGLESNFNNAVQALDLMIDTIHASQKQVAVDLAKALKDGSSSGLDQLRQINAPEASTLVGAVGGMNAAEFSCAIDGMPCALPGKPGNASNNTRGIEMTEVANSSRPSWTASRGYPTYLNPQFLTDLMFNIQGSGVTLITSHNGSAKTVNGRGDSAIHNTNASNNGTMSGAHDHGGTFSYWRHGIGGSSYKSEIYSDANSGYHTNRKSHQGQHDKFQGSSSKDLLSCTMQGNCFMKFRADADRNDDYGQPRVYSYVTMRLRAGNVAQAPWQLNNSATVSFQHKDMGTGTIQLAANEGAGLSKALVYYHRLGSWKEQPNMFAPFWRAKLHPFTAQEAAAVLNAAGQSDAAQLAATPKLSL
ncbi:pilus assembly protein TadG-related protein [Hyalangium versicolor]|uniref:pilus assembly protein TadG-related protein n=1 Tax=Hyalangium versicolor TaxID=2861190 RepID=UPI001CCFDB5C|nr:pilus assembly protein TadG-related protein [Hyalangium versicolor]